MTQLRKPKNSKRRAKKRATAMKYLLLVVEAINKIGCAVEDFFIHAAHAVEVPKWFKPEREVERFKSVRTDGVEEHPGYKIPKCILTFAEMVHSASSPQAFFNGVQARAIRRSAPLSVSAAA